jgi:uncharacterized protein (TIGR02284 family)
LRLFRGIPSQNKRRKKGAIMATMIGSESDPIHMLKNLVQLDYDAVLAYEEAIDRVDDVVTKRKLGEFKSDHERHIRELSEALVSMGETAPTKGDLKSVLTKGKVVLASIRGDEAILKAMRSNEDDTNSAYERAAQRTDTSPTIGAILARGLDDERRHRNWIVARIEQRPLSSTGPRV